MKRFVVLTAVMATVVALALAVVQHRESRGNTTVRLTRAAAPVEDVQSATRAHTPPVPEPPHQATTASPTTQVSSVATAAPTVSTTSSAPASLTASNRTTPGTPRWIRQEAGLGGNYLNDVSFVDAAHGWAVGGWNGTIRATVDGGRTWQAQTSGTQAELTGVSFVDANHGWAVGFAGTVLVTVNGGLTWTPQHAPAGDYLAVSFVDRKHGWAVGNCGVISATTDGGATWVSQVPPPAPVVCDRPMLTGVKFVTRTDGWAVGGDTILHTTDGGASWTSQSDVGTGLYDVFFIDRTRGWVVGLNSIILATGDGGRTWSAQDPGATHIALLGVVFAGPQKGWTVGIDWSGGGEGVILGTTDGGRTWSREAADATMILRGVSAAGANQAWAVGTDVLAR